MNNRQGMNTRLPYNQRAFSPQRMMNNNFPSGNNFNYASSNFVANSSNFDRNISNFDRNSNNFDRNSNNFDRNSNFDRSNNFDRSSNSFPNSSNYNNSSVNYNNNSNSYQQQQSSSFGENSSNRYQNSGNQTSNQSIWNNSSGNNRNDSLNNQSFYGSQVNSNYGFNQNKTSATAMSSQPSNYQQKNSNFSHNSSSSFSSNQNARSSNQQQSQPSNSGFRSQNSSETRNQASHSGQNQDDGNKRKRRGTRGAKKPNSGSQNDNKSSMDWVRMRKDRDPYPDLGKAKIRPRFEDVFQIYKICDTGLKHYSCTVCNINSISEINVHAHMVGKKHKYHLKTIENKLPGTTRAQKEKHFRELLAHKPKKHEAIFDYIIKGIQKPLIGLEYSIEILNENVREPMFMCVLCDKRCDPRTLEAHLVSQNHRNNYLKKHFAPIYDRLNSCRRYQEDLPYRQEVLVEICSIIEAKFDRSSALVYEGTDFDDMKSETFENVNSKKHIDLDDFPNAEESLLGELELDQTKWLSENPPREPMDVKAAREPIELPEGTKRKRKVPMSVIDEYHAAVSQATKTLDLKFVEYERDPDSHPQYKKEWGKFWNEKVEEMSKRGNDPTGHNFHDEWCEHFLKRIREMHKDEIKWKVDQIRRSLGLSIEDVEQSSGSKRNRPNSQDSNAVGKLNIDEDDDDSLDEDFSENAPRIPKDILYVKEERIFNKFLNTIGIDESKRPKPKPMAVEKPKPVMKAVPVATTSSQAKNVQNSQPVTLVTTCRIVSTLEAELGLLAPKVLDLMSKSIGYEREHSKPSNELLFENENLILIETVKEKILGMQMAHLVTNNKTQAAEKAISEMNRLLEQHEMMISIKKTLKEMGKENASQEEIDMLKTMFAKKK